MNNKKAMKQNFMYFSLIIFVAATMPIIYHKTQHKWILFKGAEKKFMAKEFNEAIPLYNESIEAGMQSPDAFLHLGSSYEATHQFPDAIKVYRAYLDIHLEDKKARLSLARVLTWNGEYKEAETEYQKTLGE